MNPNPSTKERTHRRENAAEKARRLLTEGRVRVLHATRHRIDAVVVGDSAEAYQVRADASGYTCTCPAIGRCSHLQALMLVTWRPNGGDTDDR